MAEQVKSLKTSVRYKDTPIGKIPVDWEVVRLVDLCSISSGGALDYSKDVNAKPYPVYGSNGILGSSDAHNFSDGFVIGRVGASGSIQVISSPVWASDNTLLLTITDSSTIKWFLYYYLQKCNLPALAVKTAQPLLTQQVLKLVLIAKPGIHEQKRIAEILTTVDEAIEKTAQVIEKTRQIKKGLMQQLLTRGIGHQRFKKTSVGEIPEEWELTPIRKLLLKARIKDPRNNPNEEFKYIDISSIANQSSKISSCQLFKGADAPSRARKEIKCNDILYATVRPYLKRIALVPKELDGEICSTGFCVIRCNEGLSDYRYIFHILHTDWITQSLTDLQRGSNYPAISDNDVYGQLIALPSPREQKKIADILFSIDDQIEKETEHKRQLHSLKQGLMQVLLTGKVRVPVSS